MARGRGLRAVRAEAESAVRPWQRAEERTARALGGRRVRRARFEVAPDIEQTPGLVVEVKSRGRLPALVVGALEQASRYRVL